jgi:hypothetical protein
MIRIIVDVFDEWLNKQGVPPIESTHEATEILQHMFRASLNPGERKAKQLLRNLQQDSFGEMEEFNKYPKQRGKQPEWTASDDARMMQAAEKALKYPNIQKLLKENNGQGDSK